MDREISDSAAHHRRADAPEGEGAGGGRDVPASRRLRGERQDTERGQDERTDGAV